MTHAKRGVTAVREKIPAASDTPIRAGAAHAAAPFGQKA